MKSREITLLFSIICISTAALGFTYGHKVGVESGSHLQKRLLAKEGYAFYATSNTGDPEWRLKPLPILCQSLR